MAVLVRLRDLDACRRHPQGDRGGHGGPATGFAAHDGSRRLRPVPRTLAARGGYRPGRIARFRFTDLGDAAWDIDLGPAGAVRPAGDDAVDAEIVTEAAAICRGISARIGPAELEYTVFGDDLLVSDIIDALPALAVI